MTQEIIILSIVISLLVYEMTGLTPGGIIVPYYFAMFVDQPERIVTTVIVSLLTMVVIKLLSRALIIYGKRQFVSCVLISYMLGMFLGTQPIPYTLPLGTVIGILIPGILANEMEKQGFTKTIMAAGGTTLLIRLVMLI